MPPTLTYPGVYIEELPSGVHTITGVATSIAAFVGWAPQGPVNEAVLVQSWPDFAATFGGLNSGSNLGYAVNQFFDNGGQQAYIVRIVWDGTLPAAPGTTPQPCETAVAAGLGVASAVITATAGSVSASAEFTVGPAVLQSVSITPSNPAPLPVGLTQQLTANWDNSDGSNTAPGGVTWTSSNPAIASVSPAGLVTAVSPGTAVISVKSGIIAGDATITVTAALLTSVTLTPAGGISVGIDQEQQITATANYSDGSSADVTDGATWTTALTAAEASVENGLVTGIGPGGPASVTAAFGGGSGKSASENVTIAAAMVSMTISPLNPTIPIGQPAPTFAATGQFSDGTPQVLPVVGEVTLSWGSSNPAAATVNAASGAVTLVAAGATVITATATVTATGETFTASTTVTVKASTVTLNLISVSPATASVALGEKQQLTATGSYSDHTLADLTGFVTWNAAAGATFDADDPPGVVTGTGLSAGVSITATLEGVTSGAMTLIVTAAVPVEVTISPENATVSSGGTQTFTATVTNSDGSAGTSVTWGSSNTSIATVASSGPLTGLATAAASGGTLTLFAANPGAWGNNLQVSISLQGGGTGRFGIQVAQVQSNGAVKVVENYVGLSVNPTDPQYVVTVIDNDSAYISFIDPETGLPVVPTGVPAGTSSPISLSGGADGTVLVPASDGNFELELNADGTGGDGGVQLLTRVDIFNLLCVPGETDGPTISKLQKFCHDERAFYIVDSPLNTRISNLETSGPVGSTPGGITGDNSINSAYYFPWVQAPDPLIGNRIRLFPPCGFVAGIYAATDVARGVWKAPAGIDASLTGDAGLQYVLTDLENGQLNIQAINCLRQFKVYGDVVWGSRTLQGNDQAGSQWKYVPIRRLALFLESSLYDGTQWVVFEPNDETLWGQVRLNVGAFMQGLFQQGAFAGTTPQQAYFVKCDAENNPPPSIALGIVNILVGFAPLYPAEFVVIQIQQIQSQS